MDLILLTHQEPYYYTSLHKHLPSKENRYYLSRVDKIGKLGGTKGVIAIDYKENVAMEMNTPGMCRAHMDSKGKLLVKIYKEE